MSASGPATFSRGETLESTIPEVAWASYPTCDQLLIGEPARKIC